MAESRNEENETVHDVHQVDGFPLFTFVTKPQLDSLKEIQLYPSDIWISTYPKCGTTWTQQILRILLNKGDHGLNIDQAIPWLEAVNEDIRPYKVNIEDIKQPRAFKSHMPYHLMPCGKPCNTPCRYIYVVRNPKDVAVSYYHHYYGLQRAKNFSKETFLSWFVNGEVCYGNYFDHVLSWWPHREDKNVLFLKYEDMKDDIKSCIVKIAAFIDIELSEEKLQEVIEASSFSAMKNNPTTSYNWIRNKHPRAEPFIRKGIVGDWKTFLSPERIAQFDQFDALYEEKFKSKGVSLKLKFE